MTINIINSGFIENYLTHLFAGSTFSSDYLAYVGLTLSHDLPFHSLTLPHDLFSPHEMPPHNLSPPDLSPHDSKPPTDCNLKPAPILSRGQIHPDLEPPKDAELPKNSKPIPDSELPKASETESEQPQNSESESGAEHFVKERLEEKLIESSWEGIDEGYEKIETVFNKTKMMLNRPTKES